MKRRVTPVLLALAAGLAVPSIPSVLAQAAKPAQKPSAQASAQPSGPVDPNKIASNRIQDMTISLRIVHEETNLDELKKIGGSFATTYRVPRYDVAYKFPNKARFEAKAGPISGIIVYNGDQKMYKVGPVRKTEDVRGVGQKQSLMDMGIFARDWLTTDYEAQFQRREGNLVVYKLVQRNTDNKSHEVVWVNPKTAITEKRLSYNGGGVLVKEIRYLGAKQVRPGIFIPGRVEIYNQFGKLGAVQTVEDVKVNEGLADDLFAV